MQASPGQRFARVTRQQIEPDEVLRAVEDESAGAVLLFLGTVRNQGHAGSVKEMAYEGYEEMAEKTLCKIEGEMMEKWPLKKVRVVHRVGRLGVKEISVAIAVSSPHRSDAFEACCFAIDRIKVVAPIWKREKLSDDSEVWVEGIKIGLPQRGAGDRVTS